MICNGKALWVIISYCRKRVALSLYDTREKKATASGIGKRYQPASLNCAKKTEYLRLALLPLRLFRPAKKITFII